MQKRTALLLTVIGVTLTQLASAQTGTAAQPSTLGLPNTVPRLPSGQPDLSKFSAPDAAGFRYSPGMTAAQQAQLRAYATPAGSALVSTSAQAALNLILNETTRVSGIVVPLDQTWRTALERAALHVPVSIVTLGPAMRLNRVSETAGGAQRNAPPFSVIVTNSHIIFIGARGVEIYAAAGGTAGLHDQVLRVQQALTAARKTSDPGR